MNEILLPLSEILKSAKKRGIYLGRGTPQNRIAYFVKTGLIPHAVRKTNPKTNRIEAHFPPSILETIEEINHLKRKNYSHEHIKRVFNSELEPSTADIPVYLHPNLSVYKAAVLGFMVLAIFLSVALAYLTLKYTPYPNQAVLGVQAFLAPAVEETAPVLRAVGTKIANILDFFKGRSFVIPFLAQDPREEELILKVEALEKSIKALSQLAPSEQPISGSLTLTKLTASELSATTINGNTFDSSKLVFSGDAPSIYPSTKNSKISLDAGTTGAIFIGSSSTGDIHIGGGVDSSGCTITNNNGSFACSSSITSGGDLKGGNLTIKEIKPSGNALYDIGASDNRFRNAYLSGTLTIGSGTTTIDTSSITTGTITGTAITSTGQVTLTRKPTGVHTGTWAINSSTWNIADSTFYLNPSSVTADTNILGIAVAGNVKFSIDSEGDIYGNNLILAGNTTTGTTTVSGDLTVEGNTTLGDATTDTLTINPATLTWAGGNKTLDITGAATRTLTILNSTASQVADLDVEGIYKIGGVTGKTVTACGASQYLGGIAVTGGIITTLGSCTTVSSSWSGLTDPTANLSLTMAAFTTTFTYNATTGTGNLFTLTDTASNTGTGYLLNLTTATSSTLLPFRVQARGNTIIDTTATGGVTIGNATSAQAITIDAGTATLNVGNSNNAKTINIGTGTAIDTINIGTGATGVDVISIGSSVASLALTDADWSITTAGLLSLTEIAIGTNPAGAGSAIRLANNAFIRARNAANTADIRLIGADSSNNITIGAAAASILAQNNITFETDNTFDIGASGATRPRDLYIGRQIKGIDGSATLPVYAFGTSTTTGIFSSNDSRVHFATGGVDAPFSVGSSGFVGQVRGPDGTAAAPAFTFNTTTSTGIFTSNDSTLRFSTSGTEKVLITSGGAFSAGRNSTSTTTDFDIGGTATTNGLCHATATGTDNEQIVDCSGAPSDIAEWYETKPEVEIGDVVSPSGETITFKYASGIGVVDGFEEVPLEGKDQKIAVLQKSQKGYDPTLIGIVSTAPYQTFGEDVKEVAANPQRIALIGRVPVKFSTENGTVSPGDFLTSSETRPGYAMKASKPGRTIGIALEGTVIDEKIMVFVNPSWYDPSIYIAENGDLSIKVDNIEAKKITLTSSDTNEVLTATTSASLSASSSATLEPSILSRLDILEKLVLGSSTSSSSATFDDLTVLKKLLTTDLGITGKITAGLLSIYGLASKGETLQSYAAINTLSGDLHLQDQQLGGINILAGKVVIDTSGNLSVNNGNLKVENTITAQKGEFEQIKIGAKSSGSSILPANILSIEITAESATEIARILLTPTVLTDRVLTITQKGSGRFTVSVKQIDSQDIRFDWFIIN